MLTQTQSRNAIFQVSRGNETGLFVKQLVHMDPMNVYLMQKDATVHYMIHNTDLFKDVRQYVPEYFGYDPKTQVLVTGFFPNAQNIHEWSEAKKEYSVDQAVEIAHILHSYQKDLTEEIPNNTSLQFFNKDLPWILNLMSSPQNNADALYNLIAADPFLHNQLDEIRAQWSGNSLVHGDIKLVNFVVVNEDEKEAVKLIDWEIANIGDPLWDVAGLLQSYLFMWSIKLVMTPNGYQLMQGQEYMDAPARRKVTTAFWDTYVQLNGWSPEEAATAKNKTLKYVAARLLQGAKELNQLTPNQISPQTRTVIQISKSILETPENAAREYFGF